MSAAARTPRVRVLVVCDEAVASDIESGVFNLEGVRQHLIGGPFPWRAPLTLFLVLSSARKGSYTGNVVVVDDESDHTIRYAHFQATFQDDNEVLPLCVDLGECEFPQAGSYSVQVWFSPPTGRDVLKAEQPFYVFDNQE